MFSISEQGGFSPSLLSLRKGCGEEREAEHIGVGVQMGVSSAKISSISSGQGRIGNMGSLFVKKCILLNSLSSPNKSWSISILHTCPSIMSFLEFLIKRILDEPPCYILQVLYSLLGKTVCVSVNKVRKTNQEFYSFHWIPPFIHHHTL